MMRLGGSDDTSVLFSSGHKDVHGGGWLGQLEGCCTVTGGGAETRLLITLGGPTAMQLLLLASDVSEACGTPSVEGRVTLSSGFTSHRGTTLWGHIIVLSIEFIGTILQ